MATPSVTTLSLEDQIQALPQELQDEIFAYFMALLPAGVITIDKHYKPPVQLQINHKLRAVAIEKYYSRPQAFTIALTPSVPALDSVPSCIFALNRFTGARQRGYELRIATTIPCSAIDAWDALENYDIPIFGGDGRGLRLEVRWWSFDREMWQEEWMNWQEARAMVDREQQDRRAGRRRPMGTFFPVF
ncbi:hypothetical protein Slin15195_G122960 [Septoria linicola]|uniref:Uncharacterized protein n=1 Tax=Septoria linicola TaxID=215465 RepID=A0A9Q9B7Z5_9PEZI|nr:hypothetical protein Slin14017_G079160 [Septoria linicola]USW58977.1 hypothetical protein Slin15195_G122960 [Septoria linicola]